MTKDSDLKIRRFKDGSSSWWVGYLHYSLNELNELCFVAGGIDTKNHRDILEKHVKKTNSIFVPREKSIFEQEEIDYSKISFGKFAGLSTMELVATDRKYAKWLYENSADKKIKEELKQLLKIK